MPGVAKKVLSSSSGTWIRCSWFECDRAGFELYKAILHEHARTLACDHPLSEHVNFVFCSERHKQLYRNSHLDFGQLPAGYKKSI